MRFDNMLRFKGLTFGTLGLMFAFLLYIVLNFILQTTAQKDVKYATALMQLTDQISTDLSLPETERVLVNLDKFKTGQSVRVAGESVDTYALADFLSPETSTLNDVVAGLRNANPGNAAKSAQALSSSVKNRLERKLKLINYLQIAAAIVAVVFYLLAIVPMILRLSETQDTEVKVVDETKGIMSTVTEGLFLLDHDYQIGLEQSSSLKKMFKIERDLEGDFFDFIGQYVSPHTVQTAREFLGLLYGDRVKEKLIKDLNPLNEVEINLVRRDGSYESRYLDFQFNRVMEDGVLKQLLVSVTDETRRVLLEQELAETKQEQEAQMDLLLRILQVDQSQLKAFFNAAESDLLSVNATLEARGHGDAEIRKKVLDISRTVHKLKGDASALGLHKFEFAAHALEEELVNAKATQEPMTGKSLLPAITKLKDLFSELEQMQGLVEKLSQGQTKEFIDGSDSSQPVAQNEPSAQNGLAGLLHDLAKTVSERNDKRAHLSSFGLNLDQLPETLQEPMQSMAVQLVRNSVVHGALLPEERMKAGKTDYINISTSLNQTDDAYVLLVRDDGEGFDNQAILNRAVELGIIKTEQLEKIDKEQAFKLIFHPAFSRLSEANLDGGRGVGLDVVRTMAKELGGAISVQHKHGRFCQFRVSIPKS